MSNELGDNPELELNPEWERRMNAALEWALDNYENFDLVSLSPMFLQEMMDDREYHNLGDEEKEAMKGYLFKQLGFDPEKAAMVGEYGYETPVKEGEEQKEWLGQTKVIIYETSRSEGEDMYLHEMHSGSGENESTEYIVAPKDYRP